MSASGKTSVKLLLVEDNPLVLDLVFRGLEPVCDVMVANDGGDALLKVADEPPDIILSDYKMPGLDGRKLYEKLRARDKTRNVPFCSWPAGPILKSGFVPWSMAWKSSSPSLF